MKRKRWTGPLPSDLQAGRGATLKEPVPPERWPYGPPEYHGVGCILHRGGLFCDCLASAEDELP